MRYVNIRPKQIVFAGGFFIFIVLVSSFLSAQMTPPAGETVRPPVARPASPAAAQTGSVKLPTAQTPAAAARPPAEEAPPREAPAEEGAPAEGGEKKAEAKAEETQTGDEKVYLNVQDQEIKDVIRQISKATGKNFIIQDNQVSGKVTIMSERMMTKEEAYQAFLSALEVAGYTTVTGPGGIIKIVKLGDAKKSPIPIHVDSTPYTDSYVTRLISLKNISANDMVSAIKDLISKNGTLFAYPATNTLIITDSGTNIDRLMKLMKELDQEGPQQVLEIIPIHYADAKDVAQKVLNLFELEKSGQPAAGKRPAAGGELEELKAVSKIIADDRTNSIIVLASKRAIDKVREVIAKLDVPLSGTNTGTIHVHYLKYANAEDIATTLQSIVSGQKAAAKPAAAGAEKGKTAAPSGPLPVTQLEGGIQIGADKTSNALIITASAKDYQTLVDELISKLDRPNRQVFLEAVVMELEVAKGRAAGVSGFGGGGNKTVLGFGSVSGNSSAGQINTMAGLFNPQSFFGSPGLLGGLLSKDSVTISLPKSGGGTQDVTIPAFAAFMNIMQAYRDFNIVSTPNILTLDNQKASIEVSRTEYANTSITVAQTGSVQQTPTPFESGLTLEITPQITEGNAVRLQIHHKLSNFTGAGAPPRPQTKREITTTVVAMDDQTVVLGGLMEDVMANEKTKVPILGDIPLLGLLFQQTTAEKKKSNLLVFITPHVVKDPADFAEISRTKIEQRNRFIDSSYGKRQQQLIKDTIATHRADLLDYTMPATPSSSPAVLPPLPQPGAAQPEEKYAPEKKEKTVKGKGKGKVEETTLPPAPPTPPAKAPVITVPPLGSNPSQGGVAQTTKEIKGSNSPRLDTAY